MTNELKLELEEIGRAYGKDEVECWKDHLDGTGRSAPEFALGEYCGEIPGLTDENRDELESVIDKAAREVWDAAWTRRGSGRGGGS